MKKLFFIISFLIPFFCDAQTAVFVCGFECGVKGTNGEHWISTAANSFNTSTVRSGARSFEMSGTASTSIQGTSVALTASNKWVLRAYIRFATLPDVDFGILGVNTVASTPLAGAVFKQSDSKIYAGSSASAAFGATGVSVTTGVWYKIDVSIDASANPWLVDVKVDGTACGQYSRAVASASPTLIILGDPGTSATADFFADDLIASNTLANYPITAGYVNHFIPTTDGTHNVAGAGDFQRTLTGTDILNATTTAFQLIDDVPLESGSSVDWINIVAPPNATDYVEWVFGPASGISTPTTAPRAVEVLAAIHQAGTGTGNMAILLNDNGTTGTIYTATTVAGSTTVVYKRAMFTDPPSAASAWTLSGNGNFNNLKGRFGSPAAVDANPDQYLDCIMLEAEFETVAAGTPTEHNRLLMGVGHQPVAYNKFYYNKNSKP